MYLLESAESGWIVRSVVGKTWITWSSVKLMLLVTPTITSMKPPPPAISKPVNVVDWKPKRAAAQKTKILN